MRSIKNSQVLNCRPDRHGCFATATGGEVDVGGNE